MSGKVETISSIEMDFLDNGSLNKFNLHLVSDGLGNAISAPIMVAKGKYPGPTLGLIAAVHGNEINGISVIQKIFQELNIKELRGNLIALLVANVPGFLLKQRRFNDNIDLNHIMPGKRHGKRSDIYAHRILKKFVKKCDYLVDLHTASFGRVNTYYVRANLQDPKSGIMANLQNCDIILNNKGIPGTLRRAATDLGIPCITVELRDPNRFQKDVVKESCVGITNLLWCLQMTKNKAVEPKTKPTVCSHSYWVYTDTGGILEVTAQLYQKVNKGDEIARTKDIFGEVIRQYRAPEDGIVIGKSIDPVGQTGSRIIHLGIFGPIDTQKTLHKFRKMV